MLKINIERTIALVVAVILTIGLCAPVNCFAAATLLHTQDEAVQWINDQIGKKLGTGVCADLSKAYYQYLLGYTVYSASGGTGNGADYDDNAHSTDLGWSKGTITKDTVLQPGDVLVHNDPNNKVGHVALFLSGTVSKPTTVEQNYSNNEFVKKYSSRTGLASGNWVYVRPNWGGDKTSTPAPPPTPAPSPTPTSKPTPTPKPVYSSDFEVQDGVVVNYVGKGGDCLISDGITAIGDMAFYGQDSITSVTISNGVKSIGGSAFAQCNNLKKVQIADSVTSIGSGAFYSCEALESVNIPTSVTKIENGTFSECSALSKIFIPKGVSNLGDKPFVHCTALKEIQVATDNANYKSLDGVLFSKDLTKLISYPLGSDKPEYIVPDGVTTVYDYAFMFASSLRKVTIPDSVKSIGENAFFGDHLTIIAKRGSFAEVFAHNNGIDFEANISAESANTVPAFSNNPSSWAFSSVEQMQALGLIPDILKGEYTQNITREQFCWLAVRLYEKVKGEITTLAPAFADSSDTDVRKMAGLGVVSGVGGNKFNPGNDITRQEAAVMLARLLIALDCPLSAAQPTFADNASIASWARDFVGMIQAAGIMNGVGNNNFSPTTQYTREQSIVTMYKVWEKVQSSNTNALNKRVDEIIAKYITAGMSDLDKERVIHDWIITNAVYDYRATLLQGNGAYDPDYVDCFTAYGVIMNGRGVCEGFSEAMKLFMDKLGIPCTIVTGTPKVSNRISHSWNNIKIGGVWYEVDLTWDNRDSIDDASFDLNKNGKFDPMTEAAIENWAVTYRYFNRSTAEFGHKEDYTYSLDVACNTDMSFDKVFAAKTLPEFYVLNHNIISPRAMNGEYGEKERGELAALGVSSEVLSDWGWIGDSYYIIIGLNKAVAGTGISVEYEYVYANEYTCERYLQHKDDYALTDEDKPTSSADFTSGAPGNGTIISVRYVADYGKQQLLLGDDDMKHLDHGFGESERQTVFALRGKVKFVIVLSLGTR